MTKMVVFTLLRNPKTTIQKLQSQRISTLSIISIIFQSIESITKEAQVLWEDKTIFLQEIVVRELHQTFSSKIQGPIFVLVTIVRCEAIFHNYLRSRKLEEQSTKIIIIKITVSPIVAQVVHLLIQVVVWVLSKWIKQIHSWVKVLPRRSSGEPSSSAIT